jgi:hypothetical protein
LALIEHVLDRAQEVFRVVRLRTATPEATALYVRCGFVPVTEPSASKVLQ